MRTAIKAWSLRIASFALAASMAVFGFASASAIFMEIIPIVQKLSYTSQKMYAILIGIALVLIWLVVLLADSAEHIIKIGFKKADNILIKGENNE